MDVRRGLLAVLFVLGFGSVGALSGGVVAQTVPTSTGTTATSTSSTGTTTTPPPTLPPTGTTPTTPRRVVLPRGVRIAGVPVGGLSPSVATAAVRKAFSAPLVLVYRNHRFAPSPTRLGAVAYVRRAVHRARSARAGTSVRLLVTVRRGHTRSYVAALARRFDRDPVDSHLLLRGATPWLSKERPGRKLERSAAVRAIVRALLRGRRGPVRLGARSVEPAVTRRNFGPVIVIRRGSKRLLLYDGMRLRRTFGVATGQSSYPTPLGHFSIVVMARNPWWYPPASSWAKGLSPVPPGPGNPLGTRWMGLSAPGVGIHGTPDAASIGYSASHGCIRMRIPEAEWLFANVRVGTPVFIVSA